MKPNEPNPSICFSDTYLAQGREAVAQPFTPATSPGSSWGIRRTYRIYCIIPTVCSGSALRSSLTWAYPEHIHREVSRKRPDQMLNHLNRLLSTKMSISSTQISSWMFIKLFLWRQLRVGAWINWYILSPIQQLHHCGCCTNAPFLPLCISKTLRCFKSFICGSNLFPIQREQSTKMRITEENVFTLISGVLPKKNPNR